MCFRSVTLATIVLLQFINICVGRQPPNIILILADDLGFNDVGFHGSNQIPTPNIDALAYHGIILNRHYGQALCTPTRAALLTGKYPIHTGMQSDVIWMDQPWGLSLDEKLLPEILKENGYKTHLIGKWHLGFYRKAYTPTLRGFDSHFGYVGSNIHYFSHLTGNLTLERPYKAGLDMRRNLAVNHNVDGKYATDLFTDAAIDIIENHNRSHPLFLEVAHLGPHAGNFSGPLPTPIEEIRRFYYMKGDTRRRLAATISIMDKSLGKVVKALKQKQMLDNSVILFLSDNGGQSIGYGATNASNYPLRGQKNAPWDGGTRSVAAIWSPLLVKQQRVSNQLMHITDWYPTLLGLANITINHTIDGLNMWNSISNDAESPRKELVINIDPIMGYGSIIKNDFKIVNGTIANGLENEWYGQISDKEVHPSFLLYSRTILKSDIGLVLSTLTNSTTQLTNEKIRNLRQESKIVCTANRTECNADSKPCLFNIINDPCERNNLANIETKILNELKESLNFYAENAISPRNKDYDVRANPENFNGTWTWWWDELGIVE